MNCGSDPASPRVNQPRQPPSPGGGEGRPRRDGGATGAPGRVTLGSGRPIDPKGRQSVPGGDFIRLELPGGGGFGTPADRDPEQVALDVADGLISRETARDDYRVALTANGGVELAETR